MQSHVTDVLEEAIQFLGELYYLKTENRVGLSKITVYVKKEIRVDQMQQLWDKLRRKVKDVTKVEIHGMWTPTIDISISSSVMARSGVTTADIVRTFEASNKVVDAVGVTAGSGRVRIESTGSFYSLDDIRQLSIVSRSGEHFRLADIAYLEEGYVNPHHIRMRIDRAYPVYNGKIKVLVNPPYSSDIIVSEGKYSAFKLWLNYCSLLVIWWQHVRQSASLALTYIPGRNSS